MLKNTQFPRKKYSTKAALAWRCVWGNRTGCQLRDLAVYSEDSIAQKAACLDVCQPNKAVAREDDSTAWAVAQWLGYLDLLPKLPRDVLPLDLRFTFLL